MLSIGTIGCRGHAARIIERVERSGIGRIALIHHPGRRIDSPLYTPHLEDLRELDAVLILSPNASHARYLSWAADYPGYVFCEKPPIVQKTELALFERLEPDRTFFNFNLRYSRLARFLTDAPKRWNLGSLVSCDILATHGLAFSPKYIGSWRADPDLHSHGLAETVAIHFVDLLATIFPQMLSTVAYVHSNIAHTGKADDTCRWLLALKGGGTASITASYAAPAVSNIVLLFANGLIHVGQDRIVVKGPRDTFDSTGGYSPPPEIHSESFDFKTNYIDSLDCSVKTFLEACRDRRALPQDAFDRSAMVNRLLVNLS